MNNFCYIHIPFCNNKCRYCRFASIWNIDSNKIDLYVNHLINEIKNYKIDFNNLKSIYFGWWTPSILSIKHLNRIIKAIETKTNFTKEIEITLEINPTWFELSKLDEYKQNWINRISIWIQTLNEKSLKEIWRWNKSELFNVLNSMD